MLRSTRFRLSARRPSSIACRRHLLLEPIERRILFATFTVTSLDNTGPGTLREAIGFANDEINFPGLDTINFGVSGTITLASELAISFVETNPNIGENITVVLKDTGSSTAGATQAAQQALSEGASLILGPLRADQVTAAGQVAKAAGVPVIGFSNNSGAASPGVYLLNVLPESEVKRSMGYAKKLGKKASALLDLVEKGLADFRAGKVK